MPFEYLRRAVAGVGIPRIGKKGILKTLDIKDVKVADAITTTTTSWARVASYSVRVQSTHKWGFGREGVEQANLGILHFLPKQPTSGTAIPCAIRLSVVNDLDIVKGYIIENIRSERLAKDLVDGKSLVWFLAEQGVEAVYGDKMVIDILVDTAGSYSGTQSALKADTTVYL